MENTEKTDYSYIGHRITEVRRRLAAAAEHSPCGQVPELLLASKYATAEEMNYAAHCCGVHLFGENRVSALLEKYERLDRNEMELHFIGSLQTNKVKLVVGKAALIHSLDSRRLAEAIERQAERVGVVQDVLLEVNSAREPNKGGLLPEDVRPMAEFVLGLPHIHLRGLMTMGKNDGIKEHFRPYFAQTRRLFEALLQSGLFEGEPILSMGMSDSFEIAAQEGATLVRVGTALFAGADEPQAMPRI